MPNFLKRNERQGCDARHGQLEAAGQRKLEPAADWDTGVVPDGAAYDAILPAAAALYAVTILGGETSPVDTVTVSADARLAIGGTLNLSNGGTSTVLSGGVLDGGSASNAFVSGTATLLNQGTIAGDVAGGALFLFDPYLGLTVTNAGLMEALNGGELLIETPKFTNFAGGVLTGGSYAASGSGSVLAFWGSDAAHAFLATDAADVTLDGAGSEIESGASGTSFRTIESTLSTIADGGSLHLLGARSYTPGAAVAVNGLLDLRGGSFAGTLNIAPGGRLSGFGSVGNVANSGVIEAKGGILTLNGAFAGGNVTVDAGATLALHGTVSNQSITACCPPVVGTLIVNGPVTGNGGFLVQSTATLELASASGAVAFNGYLAARSGSTLRAASRAPCSAMGWGISSIWSASTPTPRLAARAA